ncbi:DEAD/DEAH box helicase family protein [Streptomyces scopuliridis]|uniref:DEAD/DEAH box helicase family protein n=1 Tax=Streptomyces scopuliridis TaxID=452529 RepID=UPI0036C79EBA
MTHPPLRPHQREAVDAVLRALELPAQSLVPERGLRTQVIMATGSGKTLVAVRRSSAPAGCWCSFPHWTCWRRPRARGVKPAARAR